MKRLFGVLLLVAILLVGAYMVSGCSSDEAAVDDADDAVASLVDAGDPILDPAHWRSSFHSQFESFSKNAERGDYYSYLEAYPWLSTIYEGSGFAKGYYSARSHAFTVADLNDTARINEKSPASCLSCKSPEYAIAENRKESNLYGLTFFDVRERMTHPVTCYDCHKNEPGRGKVGGTLPYEGGYVGSIRLHFDEGFPGEESANAACGQCHNEYYFNEERAVTLPAGLYDPTEIYQYYQDLSFVDYTSPSTGTGHLKVQHPEYQVYIGTVHDQAGLTCATCHMEKLRNNDGQFTSHRITNPVESETVRKSVCIPCHPGESSLELIADAQKRTKAQTAAVAERLAAFNKRFAAVVSAGRLSDEQLAQIRSLNREATWYWDWVFVENSHGAHNSAQAKDCLDKANALIEQAEALLP